MPTMKDAAGEFLANKRVAVTGVSRKGQSHGANVIYQRLRQRGYQASPSTRTPTKSRVILATPI